MTKSQTPNPKSGHWSLVIAHCSLLIFLCAVALAPLLRADSPCTHDGGLHYYRVTAMRHALQDGFIFTRYLPDLAFGYGYPFFNYRAPLSYYLALVLYLTGLALPAALNLVYVLSIAGSAIAAYLLARDLFGPRAGLVAAVAYAYAPYQFLDALLRGNAPESLALPLFPLILWAFRRLALTGRRRWFLVSVGSLVALFLTHNISTLLFAPFLVAYLFVLWLVYRREGRWIAVGGALALAFGLTAFFLLPALLEQDYAQLHMSHVTRNNDFHYNFLRLAEIFAPPAPVDTSLMNPPMEIHLGLVQVVLACIGLVVGISNLKPQTRERRASLIFFAISAGFMIFMSTRASLWLWEHVPLLPFVQFPWRFVGRAALPVALLASAIASRLTFDVSRFAFNLSRAIPLISILLIILAAFPFTYPPKGYCPHAPRPTITDLFAYEHVSKLVGVDPEGSYFPAWVKRRPDPEKGSPLEAQYETADPVARFDETVMPAAASVVEADYGFNHARVLVETPAPFRARYLAFYFPGWQVRVDGEPAEIAPTDPDGLIAFDVLAGIHTVTVRFGETPLRLLADAISLLSLAVGILVYWHISKLGNSANLPIYQFTNLPTYQPTNLPIYQSAILFLAILLLASKLAIVDRIETPFRRHTLQPDGSLLGVEHSLGQPYADSMTLVGYDQSRVSLPADDTLRLDLYWTARARPTARYQSVVHLVGPDGLRWSKHDSFRPRGYAGYPPTDTWDPGRYALDSHEVEPLPGAPPGAYDVVLTMFDKDTLAPLSVLDEQGQPAAPTLTLGQVTLIAPRRPTNPDKLDVRRRLDVSLGPVTLLGADFDRDRAAPGDPVLLTTFWRADGAGEQGSGGAEEHDLTAHLILQSSDGSTAAAYDLLLTSAWQPGDIWRGQHLLYLPATLDTAVYSWRLTLLPIYQSTSLPSTIRVTAPAHTFTPPPVDIETNARLGDVATLVGANLQASNSSITVTVLWRAEAETHTSYHAFLHLLDPQGRLVAQSDGVPANWTRPTTGWLPGEYIADVRVLTIPPDAPTGAYTLSAGLYVPGGERLTAPDGADAVPVTAVTVPTQ